MIEGFVGLVSARQVRGWAWDRAQPDAHLVVEVTRDGRVVGSGTADFYRADLEAAGIGGGDHGFVVSVDPAEGDAAPGTLRARIAGVPESELPPVRRKPPPATPPAPLPRITWPGPLADPDHRPVFILGSARSGTSAVAQGLLSATPYRGFGEGHFFDLLAHLAVASDRFYAAKGQDWSGERPTMAARIDRDFANGGIDSIAMQAARATFPGGLWLDKTPNTDMIHLAPRFARIWPGARFIFMRRRAIDNIASRLRKFGYDFARNCEEWAASMEAWLSVRDGLGDRAIELDQITLLGAPEQAAAEIGALLDLTAVQRTRLAQQFTVERPEQTAGDAADPLSLDSMGWPAPWLEAFERRCGPMMRAYGYGTGTAYFESAPP